MVRVTSWQNFPSSDQMLHHDNTMQHLWIVDFVFYAIPFVLSYLINWLKIVPRFSEAASGIVSDKLYEGFI